MKGIIFCIIFTMLIILVTVLIWILLRRKVIGCIRNIYVIGSLSQSEEIKYLANYIKIINNCCVRYVKSEPNKNFNDLVNECFSNIAWADLVYVYLKPDGTIGKGTTYEVAFANYLNKDVIYYGNRKEKN